MADLTKIIWSEEAIENLESVLHYLDSHWTAKEVSNFLKKLGKVIFLISTRPLLFPVTKHKEHLRRCVLTKQTTVYYLVEDNSVFIVSLFDNRQNPEKLD